MWTTLSGQQLTPNFTKIVCWRTSVVNSKWLVDLASFPPGFRVILFSGRGQLAGKRKSFFLGAGRWFSGSFSGSLRSFGKSLGDITENYYTKAHANFQANPLAVFRENPWTRSPPWWPNWWFLWDFQFLDDSTTSNSWYSTFRKLFNQCISPNQLLNAKSINFQNVKSRDFSCERPSPASKWHQI